MPISRITSRFEAANAQGRAAFVAYMMCGDPDVETSFKAMCALAENGADVIELGRRLRIQWRMVLRSKKQHNVP
jgi:tryptophan synthase alpha chain